MRSKGYTLIELVVVVGILVIISSLITGILYSTIRGSSKSTITNIVSQNGNFALSTITGIINSSTNVVGVGAISPFIDCSTPVTGDSILLQRTDGGLTKLACMNNTIASQSAISTIELINSSVIQVPEGTCSFSCSQSNVYTPPVIEVQFKLTDKSTSLFSENKASSDFKTKVIMRNYEPQ